MRPRGAALRRFGWLAASFLALACVPLQAAPEVPRRILILDSFGREFAPYRSIGRAFREDMVRLSPHPAEFLEVSLEKVSHDPPEEPVVEYVKALCARRKVDLVIVIGAPAQEFWEKHRADLMPPTPAVIASVEERRFQGKPPGPDVVVAHRVDLPGLLRHQLDLLPGTRNVYVVIGASPLERFWTAQLQRDWQPFAGRVHLVFWNDLPLEEMLRQSAHLPPKSSIFFALLLQDAAGMPQEQEIAVDLLHDTANAPLFSWSDNFMGHGIVGGPLLPLKDIGRATARAALRILAGEPPADVHIPVVTAGRASYDSRELRRWGIDEDRLPSGSQVLFAPTSLIQRYRWVILGALLLIGAQATAITGLLLSRRRRRQAEAETVRLRSELAHAGRVSVVGQLSSSLAHELNQPLGAILRNAEAAEIYLTASPPNLEEVRAILSDIRKDDQRAGGVIDGIRTLLRRHPVEFGGLDLGATADRMVDLIRPDAQSRSVALSVEVAPDLPAVRGNGVQIQQVLLNLLLNGMEAMERTPDGDRILSVRIRPQNRHHVELTVSDSGPGIPADDLARVFENFYTTKQGGMGMGLSICRRIVEAHGGKIDAANIPGGGTTFRVTLPTEHR